MEVGQGPHGGRLKDASDEEQNDAVESPQSDARESWSSSLASQAVGRYYAEGGQNADTVTNDIDYFTVPLEIRLDNLCGQPQSK